MYTFIMYRIFPSLFMRNWSGSDFLPGRGIFGGRSPLNVPKEAGFVPPYGFVMKVPYTSGGVVE